MALKTADHYRLLVDMGVSRDVARHQALQDSVRDSDREQRESGITYDRNHVRQAIVHTREDVVVLVSYLGQVEKLARAGINLLFAAVFLLAAIAVKMLFF